MAGLDADEDEDEEEDEAQFALLLAGVVTGADHEYDPFDKQSAAGCTCVSST